MLHNTSFSVLRVLHRALATWVRNLVSFTLLSAIIHAPLFMLMLMGSDGASGPLRPQGVLYDLLVGTMTMLVHAAIVHGIARQLMGTRARVTESLVMVIECVVPLVTLGVAYGLLSYITSNLPLSLGVLGSGAFLVVYSIFAVTIPVLIIEQQGIIRALAASQELTHGYRVHIAGVYLLLGALNLVIVFGVPAHWGESDTFNIYRLLPLISALFLTPLHATGTMAMYQELRAVKDGVDLDSMRDFPQARVKSRTR